MPNPTDTDDRNLRIAREAAASVLEAAGHQHLAKRARQGRWDNDVGVLSARRALTLAQSTASRDGGSGSGERLSEEIRQRLEAGISDLARERGVTMQEALQATKAFLQSSAPQPSSEREADATAGDRRVDAQIWAAAQTLCEQRKQQPEWLWHSDGRTSFGRWPREQRQAPYVRADIALAMAAAPQPAAQPAIQEGFVLVPREPTEAMLEAFCEAHADEYAAVRRDGYKPGPGDVAKPCYRAMLVAASHPTVRPAAVTAEAASAVAAKVMALRWANYGQPGDDQDGDASDRHGDVQNIVEAVLRDPAILSLFSEPAVPASVRQAGVGEPDSGWKPKLGERVRCPAGVGRINCYGSWNGRYGVLIDDRPLSGSLPIWPLSDLQPAPPAVQNREG